MSGFAKLSKPEAGGVGHGGAKKTRGERAVAAAPQAHHPFGAEVESRSTRSRMEAAFGVQLSHLRFHERPPPGSIAASYGERVALGAEARRDDPIGRAIVAHEVAHALRFHAGNELADERGADRAALDVLLGRQPHLAVSEGQQGPLQLRRCQGAPQIPANPTNEQARRLLDRFAGMGARAQEDFVQRYYTPGSYNGQLRTLFEALTPEQRSGAYRDPIRRILQLVESVETLRAAGTDLPGVGQRQATFMDQTAAREAAEAEARRARATGRAPQPTTDADRRQAAEDRSRRAGIGTRVTNRWDALPIPPDPAQANFRARAELARQGVAAHAARVAPELRITANHLHFSPETIDRSPDTRFADYDVTNNRLNFGMDFTDTAVANPAYVARIVVHEVFGHGEHGGMTEGMDWSVFSAARPRAQTQREGDGTLRPITRATYLEWGYHGTEIYSALREVPYATAHPPAGLVTAIRPEANVETRLRAIQSQFERTIARALIRGLYARFRLDPRITPAALQLFERLVGVVFGADDPLPARPPPPPVGP